MEEISSPVIGNKCKLLAFRKVKSILIFFFIKFIIFENKGRSRAHIKSMNVYWWHVYRPARHGIIIFFLMHRDTPNTYTSVSLYQIAEKHTMSD